MGTSAVWVADDERSIRWVLDKALTREGIDVTCFESGEALLENLATETPDAIVSDIRMSGIDGLALLRDAAASVVSGASRSIWGLLISRCSIVSS